MSELAVRCYGSASDAQPLVASTVSLKPSSRFAFPVAETADYQVAFAGCPDDIREAQRLRFDVFRSEYGARFSGDDDVIDEDAFDAYCQHLIVRRVCSQEIVGTYRMLLPEQARKIGRYYSQGEFFMPRIERQLSNLVELGRSCVHPDHRHGAVIMLLWSAIARYMQHLDRRYLIGCASVSMRDGGVQAASLWDTFGQGALVDPLLEAFPKHPLPLDRIRKDGQVQIPPLIRGYLRIGAKICGAPSWDPDFNSADFLVLLDLKQMDVRYARRFGLL